MPGDTIPTAFTVPLVEYTRLAAQRDALAARCAELEANLLHYGAHMVACDFIQDTLKCSCGFEAIRAALADRGDE